MISNYLGLMARDIKFNQVNEILFDSEKKIIHSPYAAFFLTEQDKINFASDKRILQDDLGLFKKVNSIKSVFFISCPTVDSKQYNITTSKMNGGNYTSENDLGKIESYDVNIWVFDCEIKKIVAFKCFHAPPLKESYYNEFPKTVDEARINQFIKSFLISEE